MILNCHANIEVKMSNYSRDVYVANQTIWLAERMSGSKLKNQTNKLLKMTGSICSKISIVALFNLDILKIY